MPERTSPVDLGLTPELRLLLACGTASVTTCSRAAVLDLLSSGIDWTLFAGKAVAHGLTSSAAYTLAQLAPDELPRDILEAFQLIADETKRKNRSLFNELILLSNRLAANGIPVIPLRGPLFAVRAYGGLDRRDVRKLEFLVRDGDLASTIRMLNELGYERNERFDGGLRRPDQTIYFGKASRTPVEPHTSLIPRKMAIDLDYLGLWRRAQPMELDAETLLALAPEDELISLALHGGTEKWRTVKRACDFAAFVGSHPNLDWAMAMRRAADQGCLRMLLLAAVLVPTCLHAPVPDPVMRAGRADPIIGSMLWRVWDHWQRDEANAHPPDHSFPWDLLRLHDGAFRRARFLARALSWSHSPRRPTQLRKPLSRRYWRMRKEMERLPNLFAGSKLMLAITPASEEAKLAARRHQHALSAAKLAAAGAPDNPAAWRDLGDALCGLRRWRKAIACYDKALSIVPNDSVIWKRRLAASREVDRRCELPERPPDLHDATAWAVHAGRLFGSNRFTEAIEASDRALSLDSDNIAAARIGIHARLCACDWQRRGDDERRISREIAAGRQIVMPFYHRIISDSEAENLAVARLAGRGFMQPTTPLWKGERFAHGKIRLAYSSTDFRDHVVADQVAGCFEHHDKSRFELTAIALGPDDGSATRRRIRAAFDRFVDVQAMSDLAVATLLRELEIDIVIDLNGNSGDRRPGIFAYRPAPVQATFLGYPGTMGLPFYDYIIADPIVIPPEHHTHYSEQVVYLPHTLMPNDRTRPIARTPTRAEAGLPESGFVFTCHNHEYKISPEIFDIWMRLLKTVEGSVFWLKSLNPAAMINLRREAAARGVAPERLVFAPRLPRLEDHLARLKLADLFLDTRPYNAHATACDALWAGLPVVTCPGNTYPARVAASLLNAIGMPELVTASLRDYEALAAALAQDHERLARIKAKLVRNRETEPLFDTARFTRDFETACEFMWKRQQDGLPPASFAVDQMTSRAA